MWIDRAERAPTAEDADEMGCVIVWHAYQHAMVMGWREAALNQFVTHWMRLPEKPPEG